MPFFAGISFFNHHQKPPEQEIKTFEVGENTFVEAFDLITGLNKDGMTERQFLEYQRGKAITALVSDTLTPEDQTNCSNALDNALKQLGLVRVAGLKNLRTQEELTQLSKRRDIRLIQQALKNPIVHDLLAAGVIEKKSSAPVRYSVNDQPVQYNENGQMKNERRANFEYEAFDPDANFENPLSDLNGHLILEGQADTFVNRLKQSDDLLDNKPEKKSVEQFIEEKKLLDQAKKERAERLGAFSTRNARIQMLAADLFKEARFEFDPATGQVR